MQKRLSSLRNSLIVSMFVLALFAMPVIPKDLLKLSSPTSAAGFQLVRIFDNQSGTVLSVDSLVVTEGNSGTSNAEVTVRLNTATEATVTVNYQTFTMGATSGVDFQPVSGTLTFAPGVTTQIVTVPIVGDLLDETDEMFRIGLSNPVNAGISVSSNPPAVTILDDDAQPSISVNDVDLVEGTSGTTLAVFTATLSAPSGLTVSANFATADSSASAPTDYQSSSGQVVFNPGELTKQITIVVNNDSTPELHESFLVNLTTPVNTSLTDAQGIAMIFSDDAPGGTITFSSPDYDTTEFAGQIILIVDRKGNTSSEVTVDFATSDGGASLLPCTSSSGLASARCDFTSTLGTLRIPAGQTAIAFEVLITQDYYVEGPETLTIALSNPTGGAVLGGSTSTVTSILTITDPVEISTTDFIEVNDFVRQHYHDFLNREADSSGLQFWTNQILDCGSDQQCREVKRINVSAAFFLSIEFQETGYYVERLYKVAYGDASGTSTLGGAHQLPVPIIRLDEFLADSNDISRGLVVAQFGWQQVLENNKQLFTQRFVERARFLNSNAFPPSLTSTEFVDKLNINAGNVLSAGERTQLINDLSGGVKTKAQVLRAVAEDADLVSAEKNRAFVLMQYFGYLRRNPNDNPDSDYTGYDFWLNKLNHFNGHFVDAEMVKAFILSGEYLQRFGP